MELQYDRTLFKVKLYGKSYDMRKPTTREIVNFQKSIEHLKENDLEERIERLTEFFVSLGLSKDCVYEMEPDHMSDLLEKVSSSNKKK